MVRMSAVPGLDPELVLPALPLPLIVARVMLAPILPKTPHQSNQQESDTGRKSSKNLTSEGKGWDVLLGLSLPLPDVLGGLLVAPPLILIPSTAAAGRVHRHVLIVPVLIPQDTKKGEVQSQGDGALGPGLMIQQCWTTSILIHQGCVVCPTFLPRDLRRLRISRILSALMKVLIDSG